MLYVAGGERAGLCPASSKCTNPSNARLQFVISHQSRKRRNPNEGPDGATGGAEVVAWDPRRHQFLIQISLEIDESNRLNLYGSRVAAECNIVFLQDVNGIVVIGESPVQ